MQHWDLKLGIYRLKKEQLEYNLEHNRRSTREYRIVAPVDQKGVEIHTKEKWITYKSHKSQNQTK